MNKKLKSFLVLPLILLNSGCSLFGVQSEERLSYNTILKQDNIEVREYSEYIAATTTVEGDYDEAQNKAFKVLAGYIFGGNQGNQDISMTAPVLQKTKGEEIAMTAPVLQKTDAKKMTMSFKMPSRFKSIDDLPKPNNPDIKFENIRAKKYAAIKYSWYGSEKKNRKMANKLLNWINSDTQYQASAEPIYAGYNPPWTLPFFRRNEVLIEVTAK